MLTDVVLPDPSQLELDSITSVDDGLVFGLAATQPRRFCPCCRTSAERVHSRYRRCPADLPVAGLPVSLNLEVRRFFCDQPDCRRRIFAERLPDVVAPYARRTERLAAGQQAVALACGGELGGLIMALLGMPISPDTLLRLIRQAPDPYVDTPRVLGVDDWAQRKGHSYGTILVDLESHRPVDLLPERSADSLETWLRTHPGVEIISRDRSQEYIQGASEGAPDARQVADRWHLLKNLHEALEGLLERKPACLKAAAEGQREIAVSAAPKVSRPETSCQPERKLTQAERAKADRRARRQARYERVWDLYKRGLSKTEIARHVRLDRKTVRRYLRSENPPQYPSRPPKPSKLDPYKDYLQRRWEEGCRNTAQLLREIREQGYDGGRTIVRSWIVQTLRSGAGPGNASPNVSTHRVAPWSARRAAWTLLKQSEDLTPGEHQGVEWMQREDEDVVQAQAFGKRFVQMLREHQDEALEPWLDEVAASGLPALKRFARGIRQYLAAVHNALRLSWSQGQVEGQINRLKLLKRQMYGRANFDLLRKRVLIQPMQC
ncbi:MAG: ISL3 family transposase [Salinibacter sp.]